MHAVGIHFLCDLKDDILAFCDVIMYHEYGNTPYVGMVPEKNGVSVKCVQNDMFITLL